MLKINETHFFGQVTQKALIQRGNKVLLVQYPDTRSDIRINGKWDMPGGRLNAKENVLEGLKREVLEEIGIEIKVEKIIATGTFINLSGKENFFVIYNASTVDDNKEPAPVDGEVGQGKWVNLSDFFALPIIYPEYQNALKNILI